MKKNIYVKANLQLSQSMRNQVRQISYNKIQSKKIKIKKKLQTKIYLLQTYYFQNCYFLFKMIYFGDPELVEKHLHQDLNIILKNVKIRQEQHLQLLQYNKAIAIKKRSIQTTIFINDQITTHIKFLDKVLQVNQEVIKEQQNILEKYDEAAVKFDSVIKLMSRVVTRILQTNQTYIQKIKSYDESFNQHFNKMKNLLTKLVNNKEQIDLSLSTKTIIEYTKNKAVHQIQKLKLLIKSLQDGEIEKVPFIYKGIRPPEPHKVELIKFEKPIQKIEKKCSPPKKQQKHEMVNKLKQEIKAQQKLKKQKKNVANRLMTMYSTMDLSRKQFLEDIVHSNPKQQFDKIYGQIWLRNKFNQDQILQFQGKKEEFQQKVKIFKETMIQQSNRIQEVLMIKKPVKIQKKQDSHSQSSTKLEFFQQNKNPQCSADESSPTRSHQRAFILRQKVVTPKFHKQTQLSQFRITQDGFNHIKFDTSNQQIFLRSNRNRLPYIPSIQTKPFSGSVDNSHRYHISKPKQEKGTARKNFLMKNVQVGVQNMIKQNQNRNHSQSKSIAQKLKQIHPSAMNSNNLLELTFYGSKKKSFALGETKINFVF